MRWPPAWHVQSDCGARNAVLHELTWVHPASQSECGRQLGGDEGGRGLHAQSPAERHQVFLKVLLKMHVEHVLAPLTAAHRPRDERAHQLRALSWRERGRRGGVRQARVARARHGSSRVPSGSASGPTSALSAATGRPVCSISTHFTASSPNTVGGRPSTTCQKSCTSLYRCIT